MAANTPKEQLNLLMVEIFMMIEELDIQEGKYLQFADLFKQMNLNVNRLAEIKTIIQKNVYYQRQYNRPIHRKRLTQAEKALHVDYMLCSCGDYIHKREEHIHVTTTLKHKTGLRNRKYSAKTGKVDIDFEINREVLLHGLCINHIKKLNALPDDV
jgi:hypothetical protein